MTVHRLAEIDPAGFEARLAACPALVIPLGTIEWHSHHLPLGLDLLKAEAIAEAAAQTSGAVLAPGSWWAAGGVPFQHTLRLETDLVARVLGAVITQFAEMGFSVICIVNGHYGLDNSRAVRRAALECMGATPATVLSIAEYEVLLDLGARGDHAGVWETSILWAARPDLVQLDAVGEGDDLPGVLGEDPRGIASAALGGKGIATAATRIATAIDRALNESFQDKADYTAALHAGLEALDSLAQMRQRLPRSQVPPVLTPAWRRHLGALTSGAYAEATEAAMSKRADAAA